MPQQTIKESNTGVSRAIRNAQRVLLRNDLDPFKFVVDIREAAVDDGKATYILEISTTDNAVSVQKAGIPHKCIDGGAQIGHNDLARYVEGMLPELLDAMKAERGRSLQAQAL